MAACVPSLAGRYDGTTEEAKLSQDYKREVDHRRKYALGTFDTGSRIVPSTPLRQSAQRKFRLHSQRAHQAAAAQSKNVGKHPAALESDATTSDSSTDEYVREASTEPVPDAEIAYSFDAARGPSQGSDILSMAINKAVERYENKATEKLVKDEYEVVIHNDEEDKHNDGYAADEDDYELV